MTSFPRFISNVMSARVPQTKYTNKYRGKSELVKRGNAKRNTRLASSFLLAPLPPKLALTTDSRGFLDKLLNFHRGLFHQLTALTANFSNQQWRRPILDFTVEGTAKKSLPDWIPHFGRNGIMITLLDGFTATPSSWRSVESYCQWHQVAIFFRINAGSPTLFLPPFLRYRTTMRNARDITAEGDRY